MSVWVWISLFGLAAAPVEVTVTPLRGGNEAGTLVEVSDQKVQITTREGNKQFEAASLQSIEAATSAIVPSITDSEMAVQLVDGSLLAAKAYRAEKGKAVIALPSGGSLEVPTSLVAWARFGKQDLSVQKQWQEIVNRQGTADRLVVRKVTQEAAPAESTASTVGLDDLQGVLSDISAETVDFQFDGSALKVPRKKIEGVVYFHAPGKIPPTACRLFDAAGSMWCLRSVRQQADSLELVSACGAQSTLPANQWTKIDYSAGNLVFLSDLKPESVRWEPYVASPAIAATLSAWFQPRFNTSAQGGPLMLNGQSYERGLALHSRTTIVYRLTEDYQHFLATVGLDDRYRSNGGVRFVVLGEKGPLFEKLVHGHDEPLDLDVDVRGVRRLQILVDFGDDHSDAGDYLNLCNARLTK